MRPLVVAEFNVLLDPFPDNYGGYLIRTDFRIGVQIALALADDDLADTEKAATALYLLYGEGVPRDLNLAFKGLRWFMKGGELRGIATDDEEEDDDAEGEDIFSFEYDALRLYSGFLKTYSINLNTARVHWFEFLGLLTDLGECAFSTVVSYRKKDTSGMTPTQRNEAEKMKRKYALPRRLSDEDQARIAEFLEALPTANDKE